jgi:PAS domain S-box-containing protein
MNDTKNVKIMQTVPEIDFFQAIAQNSTDGVVVLNAEFHFSYVSQSAYKMFGYELSDIVNVNPNDLTHPDDSDYVLPELQKMLQTPAYKPTLEYRFLKKDGDWIWIESTFTNLFDNKAVGGIVINFRDVSERVEHVRKLQLNEERYRLTQEVGLIGSWEYDVKLKQYWSSPQLVQIFGINQNHSDLNAVIESCIPNNAFVKNTLQQLIDSSAPYNIEYEIYRNDNGQKHILKDTAMLFFDAEGNPNLVRGIIVDITTQKESELKIKQSEAILTATLQHSKFSIWSIDNNYKLLYANQRFIAEYKASFDIDLKVGESIISFLPEPIKNTWVEMYDRALSNNAFVVEIPVVYDDIEIYTEVSATPIVVDGVVVGVSFYGDNITDRKRDQLNLLEKTEKLKTNAQNLHKTIVASSEFIKGDKINYDFVTQLLQQISGAKYVIFNRYEGEYSCAKSVSGFENFNQLTSKYLGFNVFEKKWNRREEMDKMLTDNKISVINSLAEILKYDFNEKLINLLLKLLGMGQVALVALNAKNRLVGNLIFIYEEKATFENSELIEMFSYQLGQYIERTNAEVALINKMDEMERFHRLTVNRELKMIELKKEINDLLQQAGKEPKYNIMG